MELNDVNEKITSKRQNHSFLPKQVISQASHQTLHTPKTNIEFSKTHYFNPF